MGKLVPSLPVAPTTGRPGPGASQTHPCGPSALPGTAGLVSSCRGESQLSLDLN